jgi:hypothetical protein
MISMTKTVAQPESRTFKAAIAVVASSSGRRTIVMPAGRSWVSDALPLTEASVTLRHNEVLVISNGKGETRYERDLPKALATARSIGSEGMADAIQILAPAIDISGLKAYNLESIHERAVAVS